MSYDVTYLILSDVVGSSSLDWKFEVTAKNELPYQVLEWRKIAFKNQLEAILNRNNNSFPIKSIGDSIFVKICITCKNPNDEKTICEKLLHDAFLASRPLDLKKLIKKEGKVTFKGEVRFRTIINKIEKLIHGNKLGNELQEELDNFKWDEDEFRKKYQLFCTTLSNDIFGREVNKSARMLSLCKHESILVSDNIVKLLFSSERVEDAFYKGSGLNFDQENHKYCLHSPVPVLEIKGCYSFLAKENKDSLPFMWHLSKLDKMQAPLALEFKNFQMFRFVHYFKTGNETIENINNEIIERYLKEKIKSSPEICHINRFYIDRLFQVINHYFINEISFFRKRRNVEDGKYRKIIFQTEKSFIGIRNFLDIEFKKETGYFVKTSPIEKDVVIDDQIIPLVLLCSYPSIEYSDICRQIIKSDNTEIQTINIHKSINIIDNNPTDSFLTNYKNKFDKFYLVFYCNQGTENNFFDNIQSFTTENVSIISYGTVSGLIDGFILFNCSNEYSIQRLLNDWSGSAFKWFRHTYPLSIFELIDTDSFETLKRNIDYLKETASVC